MNQKIARLSILSLLAAASLPAYASDVLVRPRASLGLASYSLTIGDAGSEAEATSSYIKGGFGLTIAKENLYFDLGYSTSFGATHDAFIVEEDFVRTDLNLTVGTALNNGLSVFGGFKTGESELSDTFTGLTTSFKASGIFFGASKSWSGANDSISVNAAIAFLDGELTDDDPTFDLGYSNARDASANTVGLSFGAGYNYYLSDDSGISLKGMFQSYNFTGWEDPNPYLGVPDTTERLFSAEASYFFNF